jgi:class 3 adenylate cyclase
LHPEKGPLRGAAPQHPAAHDARADAAWRDRHRRSYPRFDILFSDLVDFSSLAAKLSAEETVKLLELLFSRFDALGARYGVEKIKTIGDGYMVAGGLPETRTDHAVAVAEMALAMLDGVEEARHAVGQPLKLRVGLHTGELVAGVIGTRKFAYDVWGDAVNTAKRIESGGLPGRVHVSATTRQAPGDALRFEPPRTARGQRQRFDRDLFPPSGEMIGCFPAPRASRNAFIVGSEHRRLKQSRDYPVLPCLR